MPKEKEGKNYLDLIPAHDRELAWEDLDGKITVFIENKGFFNRLAQKLLGKPEISQIHLDEMGSFIWKEIDGERTVYEIAQRVKEQYGEEAEPLYERLVAHMRNLERMRFIEISGR